MDALDAPEVNPIENGVQQAYQEIRSSLELVLGSEVGTQTRELILTSLDDAVSNNWDELMLSFWVGVAQDVRELDWGGTI